MPLHRQARDLLDTLADLGPDPGATPSVAAARAAPSLSDADRELRRRRGDDDGAERVGDVVDRVVPGDAGDDGPDVPIRVFRPRLTGALDRVRNAVTGSALPVLVFVHGGGWVLGGVDTDEATPRALANRAQCVVVSVDYRRAPEHPFPASHDDVRTATRWVLEHAGELGGDPSRVGIAGESAGATMAAATCAELARDGGRRPDVAMLVYPVTDLVGLGDDDWPSYRDAAETPPLPLERLRWFAEQETAGPGERADPRLSLLRADAAALAAMPPTLLFTAEVDPLRDQGEAYARALMDAGVHVTHSRFPGLMHGFLSCYRTLDGARLAMLQGALAIRGGFEGYEPAAQ